MVVVERFSVSPCSLTVLSPLRCFSVLVLGSAAVPGGVQTRGSSRWHIFDNYFGPGLLVFAAVPGG